MAFVYYSPRGGVKRGADRDCQKFIDCFSGAAGMPTSTIPEPPRSSGGER